MDVHPTKHGINRYWFIPILVYLGLNHLLLVPAIPFFSQGHPVGWLHIALLPGEPWRRPRPLIFLKHGDLPMKNGEHIVLCLWQIVKRAYLSMNRMVKHSDLPIKLGKEQVIYLSTIVNHGDYLWKMVQQMWFTYDKLSTEVIYLWTNVKKNDLPI